MFNIDDYVLYKRDVCIIKEIKKNMGQDYYVLIPIEDESLKIEVPVVNKLGNIKKLITKENALEIIEQIPNIKPLEIENEKIIEQEYKKLFNSGNPLDLIKIIKTTYLRNENRILNKKRISERDDIYFNKAERLLYNELSKVLNKTYDETKKYVIDNVENK